LRRNGTWTPNDSPNKHAKRGDWRPPWLTRRRPTVSWDWPQNTPRNLASRRRFQPQRRRRSRSLHRRWSLRKTEALPARRADCIPCLSVFNLILRHYRNRLALTIQFRVAQTPCERVPCRPARWAPWVWTARVVRGIRSRPLRKRCTSFPPAKKAPTAAGVRPAITVEQAIDAAGSDAS